MNDLQRLRNLTAPTGCVDCVLDTDTYNEIDDQYALSLMMKSPRCRVRAIYAAPFYNNNSASPEDGMEKSYDEILNLLSLMGREADKANVYRGSRTYLPDERTPVESSAADHLAALAMEYTMERPLYVVAIGAITNVASALLQKPEIAERIVLVWLGGHDIHWGDTREFNMVQDIAAARIVFGCGCPLVQLPCMGVVSAFYTTEPELRHWLGGIWDVCAAAWLLNENNRFMDAVVDHAPLPTYDGTYSFDSHRHLYLRVTAIHRDALFGELFRILAE